MTTPRAWGRSALAAAALLLAGCPQETERRYDVCDIQLIAEPDSAPLQATTVRLFGGPLSSTIDTWVSADVGDATLLGVERSGCQLCDACRGENDCGPCATCVPCDVVCADCVGSVEIALGPVPADTPQSITVTNGFGSGSARLQRLDPVDDDTGAE